MVNAYSEEKPNIFEENVRLNVLIRRKLIRSSLLRHALVLRMIGNVITDSTEELRVDPVYQ
jgi:hypothetical protein